MDHLGGLRGLNLFIGIYARIIRDLGAIRLIAPFFILALFESLILAVLVGFYLPPVHKVLVPILSYFYSDYALHYPRYFLILPQIYSYGTTVLIGFLFGVPLLAAAVFVLGAHYKGERGGLREGLRTARKSLLGLATIWLVKMFSVFLVYRYVGDFIIDAARGMPRGDLAGFVGVQVLGIVLSMMFIYAIPAIMLHRQKLLKALATSFSFALKYPIFSFFLLLIPWLVSFPVGYLTNSKIHIILLKFSHTALIYLLGFDIFIGIIAGYFTYAGITYFYLKMTE